MGETWNVLAVSARRDAIDAVCALLFDLGALGTAYDEMHVGDEGDPADPLPPPPEVTRISAWFPADSDLPALREAFLAFLPRLEESFGAGAAALESAGAVADDGWGEKWKEHFRPEKVSERLVVCPSWERYDPAPGERVIVMDPGQAFGTGSHETTRLCLGFIEEALASPTPPSAVLDVGTGTGILGIAAALLGADRVLGIDNDPVAVEAARENGEGNGVARRFRASAEPLSGLAGEYDLVAANLIAETLVELKGDLVPRCAPGGLLVLSGILATKAAWVAAEFADAGAPLVEERVDGQWAALLLRRER
jgi:ribosomal protein L11 methyltransferase